MSLLSETIAKIQPIDTAFREAAAARFARCTGDLPEGENAFGNLRELLLRFLAMKGELHPVMPKCANVIACADHGVSEESVSAYPPETTVEMMKNYLISRGGAANAFAAFLGADLHVVDMGTRTEAGDIPGLISHRIANGTKNMAKGPAMSRGQAAESIEVGIQLATELIEEGAGCILPGEMGISNTTASASIAAAICHLTPEEATGRGTNISNERLARKVEVVRRILAVNTPDATDGLDVLAKVGGFEFGCIAGLILGAAAKGCPTILDGANASAAALIATTLAPAARDYLLPSHLGGEKSHGHALKKLGLTPFLRLDLRLGEAIGSSIAAVFLHHMLAAWAVLDAVPGAATMPQFALKDMPPEDPKITDKTFGFYLRTMQDLDQEALEACQKRLDNLAKPIYSLGALEEIAAETAGILGDERPITEQRAALLLFTDKKLAPLQEALSQSFTELAGAKPCLAHLRSGKSASAAFNFGRDIAEEISMSYPILALSFVESLGSVLRENLLTESGTLRYPPDAFLAHVPRACRPHVSAYMGAMIAAAHNCTLVLLDDEATEIIARYAQEICPNLRHYLLHTKPNLITADIALPGGIIAMLGLRIVYASLYMLNEMKTFAETKVSIASDGPGAGKQVRE